jgi:carbon storage regulator
MLVLSRKLGESIVIDDGIVVTILEARERMVRLGIETPEEVTVLREELAAFKQCRRKAAVREKAALAASNQSQCDLRK